MGDQLRNGEEGIVGVMIESYLHEGNQKPPPPNGGGLQALQKGVSITDACIDWDTTVEVLEQLADGIRTRRQVKAKQSNGAATATANGAH